MIGSIVLNPEGQIQTMSLMAEKLIHSYFPAATVKQGELPDHLRRWVERQVRTTVPADPSQFPLDYHIHNGKTDPLRARLSPHSHPGHWLLLLEVEASLPTQKEPQISPELPENFLNPVKKGDLSIANLCRLGLTNREAEVLSLVLQDKTSVQIAQALAMSDRTVKKHLERIHRKFGVQTRLSAIIYTLRVLDLLPQID